MKSFHIGSHKVVVLRVAELPSAQRTAEHWATWTFTINGVAEPYSAATRDVAMREAKRRASFLPFK